MIKPFFSLKSPNIKDFLSLLTINKSNYILKGLNILLISLVFSVGTSLGIDYYATFILHDISASVDPTTVVNISQDLVAKYTANPGQFDLDHQANLNKELINHKINGYKIPYFKIVFISVVGIAVTLFFK